MRHAEKTGRQRHVARSLWGTECLVLQIEERGLHTSYSAGHCDTQWVTRWRYATTADLTVGPLIADGAPPAPSKGQDTPTPLRPRS